MTTYLPFDPNPRAPRRPTPPRSCDSQFHVLGPADRYPPRPGAAYIMPSATWQAARRMHAALGIERGIVVQPTTYGADHMNFRANGWALAINNATFAEFTSGTNAHCSSRFGSPMTG